MRPVARAPVLVTGCGRSGTGWAARMLGCHHEKQYTPTRHGPLIERESSWLAIPYLDELPDSAAVIRVIRNPYNVVASALRRNFLADPEANPYGRFAVEHCPRIGDADDHLGRVIRWVAFWDAPLDLVEHAALHVDGHNIERPPNVALIDGHIDGHLIRDRAERWGYM